jgi:RNA polymerase sigma-70 factor (ECF subfamily)
MERVKAGDLVRLLLEHRDGILGFIFALTRDREAAEEVFQEVGLAVVEEAGRKAEVQRFLPWVHELARRRVAEFFRKKARRRAFERLDSLDDVVAQAFQENAAEIKAHLLRQDYLAECLEELAPTQRQMVEQRYRDRAPIRDIAESLAWTDGAVKVALWKARRRLKECVDGKMGLSSAEAE